MKKRVYTVFSLIFVAILLVGCSFNGGIFYSPKPEQPVLTTSEQQERIAQISSEYVEAVVTVFVYSGDSETALSFGSGVIVHEDGYIVTNSHVIDSVDLNEDSFNLKVAFNSSNTLHSASVEWANYMLDLAIIKVNAKVPTFVPMKDRFVFEQEGERLYALETVIAIGTSVSYLYKSTVTIGTISSTEWRVSYVAEEGNVYQHLIQHTAPINHGNSGGGLFDLDGNLIGLNTLGQNNANSMFFAVPIYPVIDVLDKVIAAHEEGSRFEIGKLGVEAIDRHQSQWNTFYDFDESGVLVLNVLPDGASIGALTEGDIITKIEVGQHVFDVDIRNDFVYGLLKTSAGTSVKIEFLRDGKKGFAEIELK